MTSRTHSKKIALVFLLMLMAAMLAPGRQLAQARPDAPQATVYPGHPRLIVGGYRGVSVTEMQTHCADAAFQDQCDNIGSQDHVNDQAMDYLLHNDAAAADSVIASLQSDTFTCSYERSDVGGYALAYDWVYNAIGDQSVKNNIEDRLADCAMTLSDTLGSNGPHLWHGYTSDASALALVALSLDHDTRRDALLDAAQRLFRENALEAYAYVDGAWPEGISYFRSHFFSSDPPGQYVIDATRAWHSAVEQDDATYADIYDTIQHKEGDWLRQLGYFHIYHLLPPYPGRDTHSWSRYGDMPSSRPETSNQHRPYTDAIAGAYNDGYLQQIGAIIETDWGLVSGQGSYHRIHRYALPTNLDPTLAPASFTSLPTAAIFGRDTAGYVAMRSGWSDDAASSGNDTLIFYRAGDWFTGHQHMDQGHFEIWRNGPLALDAGVYADWGAEHREAYYIRTVAHNSLLVRQPGETFAYGYSTGDTNDGGQRVHTYTGCAQCIQSLDEYRENLDDGKHFESGDITAFIHTGAYDYVASDITAAYNATGYTYGTNTPKVSGVQRELAYLRPNVLLIFDRVRATNASYEKVWLLHSANKPQTNSETVVQGSADNGILTSADDVFQVDAGTGRLFVQTLLPANATLRKIGGADYRYWSDGANRTGGASGYETGYAEPGLWRVEVVPSAAQLDDVFLHALYITDTTGSAMPTVSGLSTSGGEMTGAHVQEAGRERVVLFSAAMDGAPFGNGVQYDVTTNGVCGHLLAGVPGNADYQVSVGASQETVRSTAEHTLYFTTTAGGALHIDVTPQGAPPEPVHDLHMDNAVIATNAVTVGLRWTAPLNAVTTTLRYSPTLITANNWGDAAVLSDTLPGNTATYTSSVPYAGGVLYFALKTQNAAGAWSEISNIAFWPRRTLFLPLILR